MDFAEKNLGDFPAGPDQLRAQKILPVSAGEFLKFTRLSPQTSRSKGTYGREASLRSVVVISIYVYMYICNIISTI